ncbi:MAG: hypothetical protein B6D41_01920 [Chloroflexi bacterium UTCFX4]|jgi:hypothetical protein|nr:MAG: hypothetical protein B6D41_01920 [Chloroflexi bacterium UTCFX4]
MKQSEKIIVWIMRALTVSFAAVGLLFLFAPDATLAFGDALGARVGTFAPAPPTGAKLWLSLGVAYMALVTALAFLASRDPRKNRVMMLLLALGKATSSLTSLWFFLTDAAVFIYLLNFIVDGLLTALALGCWWVAGKE